jgi:hypothetical protein
LSGEKAGNEAAGMVGTATLPALTIAALAAPENAATSASERTAFFMIQPLEEVSGSQPRYFRSVRTIIRIL